MTQTPASGPFELVTVPPISSETILISAAGFPAVCAVRTIPRAAASPTATIASCENLLFIKCDLLRRRGQWPRHSLDIHSSTRFGRKTKDEIGPCEIVCRGETIVNRRFARVQGAQNVSRLHEC